MTQVATLTPKLRQQLNNPDDKSLITDLEEANEPDDWDDYPKPDLADVENMYARLTPQFDAFWAVIEFNRIVRYLMDDTPEKWARRLQNSRRFRSRMSHNENLRIAAMMTRNAPRIRVPKGGRKAADQKRADAQSRWCNNFLPSMERRSSRPIVRRFCDNVAGDGMGIFEFFLTDSKAYKDTSAADPKEFYDPKTGINRPETAQEVMDRMDEQLMGAKSPFGIRSVDPLSVLFDEDEDGFCAALIVEQKPYRQVFNKISNKDGRAALPKPGTNGWPNTHNGRSATRQDGSIGEFSELLSGGEQSNAQQSVVTMRYADRRWYMYIVGGVVVDGPREHGLPGLPIFPCWGMTTGSPNLHEMAQGVTWGMTDMELAINDLMTLAIDVAYTYSRPKPVVETDAKATRATTRDRTGKPLQLDLSSDSAPYLEVGQRIVDAYASFRPNGNHDLVRAIMDMWQRSGLQPVASGESPGADVAGYTVNTLSQAAQSQYEILLDNYARTLGNVIDFARLTIRDTIKDKVFLSVPMGDDKNATEWLGLGPEDIDETPCIVTIDPLSDANRMALRQSLAQGNKEGYVPLSVVQTDGYGADDPEAWQDELAVDAGVQDLVAMAREDAKSQIYGTRAQFLQQQGAAAQQAMGAAGGGGTQLPMPEGSQPAPLQPPTVGAANMPTSNGAPPTAPGPAMQTASAASAGEARGGGGPGGTRG